MKKLTFWIFFAWSPASLGSIGISIEQYEDTIRGRSIEAKVLYPAGNAKMDKVFAENPAFYGVNAVADAKPFGRNLPVYFLVHGTTGNWKNLSWLASALAESGALVVSADHPGYMTGQGTPERVLKMWEQPRDVSFLIDQILSGKYAEYIDKTNITVVGYSLGGYTALALAGARFDISGYERYCSQNLDASCAYFQDAFSALSKADRLLISGDYKDSRVVKSIAVAPGFVPAVLPDSLQHLSAHTVVVGAEHDSNVPTNLQLTPYLTGQSHVSFEQIPGASHFSFMQVCKPEAMAILAEEGAEFVCQEASGVDRDRIHEQLFDIVTKHAPSHETHEISN